MTFHILSELSDRVLAVWISLAPFLLMGALLAGIIHVILPPQFIRNALSGRRGVWRAVLIGIPLPLCSCGVIPAGLGLRREGASEGATVGFLISTPQTGVDSILVSASLLGLPFAIYKVIAAAITGLIGGLITDRVDQSEVLNAQSGLNTPLKADTLTDDHAHSSLLSRIIKALRHAESILSSIWGWILIGVLASAFIDYVLPESLLKGPDSLDALSLSALVGAYALTLGLSLPLYVCATASVPIAATLVAKGFPVGVALVFLMAGPATNLATLGAVYRGLGKRALITYLGTIIIGSLAFALSLDLILGWRAPADLMIKLHKHEYALWELILAAILGVWMLLQIGGWLKESALWARRLLGRANHKSSEGTLLTSQEHTTPISGLKCQKCVRRLKSALLSRGDISECEVSEELDTLWVRGELSVEELSLAVIATGFISQKASPSVSSKVSSSG